MYYQHISTDAVNVFASDLRLHKWIRSLYPALKVEIIQQGSALMEGILKYDDHSSERQFFGYVDRGILHAIVTENRKLLYYNQFAVRKSEDYLKYIMTVFKEIELSPKKSKVIMWGSLRQDSKHINLLKKYIRNISYGGKPAFLNFNHVFDEIPDHHYFDKNEIEI